ncbi:uncharacterized protein isoform X3 [Rhodnius prolixus]|uniref:uncharacterized protein isoform X3 n=2 Tax=Rhodnius prolixus TaxID=13249 RepID=UPI003D18E485
MFSLIKQSHFYFGVPNNRNRVNNSFRTNLYGPNMNQNLPNFQRIWNYNNGWNQNNNFQNTRPIINHNRGWHSQRNQMRNVSVDPNRSHVNNFSNKKPIGGLTANAVILKIMTILCEKKKNDPNRAKSNPSLREEVITEGFFCKYCKLYLADKEQSDKHLLTKNHHRNFVERLKVDNLNSLELNEVRDHLK